jgi:signal transduction histidine kinase
VGLPGFGVVLTLVHPEILEGRLRRRAWVFGALILLGTAAAMAALVGAIRAFERQRQLALQQAEFVAAVSHELRAPLAAVRLLAEELVERSQGGGRSITG